MHTQEDTMFSDQGCSFDEIVRDGKLGGKQAVISFLQIRINQLTRKFEVLEESELDTRRLILAIQAMRDAQKFMIAFNKF